MPDVAVIIPIHDAAHTLGETLDSLRDQGADLEVIVVDDRSSDDGPALARRHPMVTSLLTSTGPGISPTRNLGIQQSTAPFLLFLDGDDLLLPWCLRDRLAVAVGLEGNGIVVGHHLERWGARDRAGMPPLLADARRTLLRGNQLPPCAALVPRRLLERVDGPFDVTLFSLEDWDLWLRLAFQGARFVVRPEADCVYRMRPVMMNHRPEAARYSLRVLDKIEGAVRAQADADELLPILRRARRDLHVWEASFAARAGDGAGLAQGLWRALRASPSDAAGLPMHLVRRALAHGRRARMSRRAFGSAP